MKSENKLENSNVILRVCLAFIILVSIKTTYSDLYYFFVRTAFFIALMLGVAFLASLSSQNKRKVFNICFVIFTCIYIVVHSFNYITEKEAVMIQREKDQKKIVSEIKQHKVMQKQQKENEVTNAYMQCFVQEMWKRRERYFKKYSFSGIIAPGSEFWLHSADLIKYLYKDAQDIVKKIDKLSLKEDLKSMQEDSKQSCKELCIKKYPEKHDFCYSIEHYFPELDEIIDKSVRLLEQNKELIHSEFKMIQCMHDKHINTSKCSKSINEYNKKKEMFEALVKEEQQKTVEQVQVHYPELLDGLKN